MWLGNGSLPKDAYVAPYMLKSAPRLRLKYLTNWNRMITHINQLQPSRLSLSGSKSCQVIWTNWTYGIILMPYLTHIQDFIYWQAEINKGIQILYEKYETTLNLIYSSSSNQNLVIHSRIVHIFFLYWLRWSFVLRETITYINLPELRDKKCNFIWIEGEFSTP